MSMSSVQSVQALLGQPPLSFLERGVVWWCEWNAVSTLAAFVFGISHLLARAPLCKL